MNNSDYFECWISSLNKSIVALCIAGGFLICMGIAAFMGDWIGVTALACAVEAIWLATNHARDIRYREMRRHGFGYLISR